MDSLPLRRILPWLAVFALAACRAGECSAGEDAPSPAAMEFWRDAPGTLAGGDNSVTLVRDMRRTELTGDRLAGAREEDGEDVVGYRRMGDNRLRVMPRDEFNTFGGSTAMMDRGIDSADTRWRRQARVTGVRMRMLNGPQGTLHGESASSETETGGRAHAGVVVPLNPRWELAVINTFASFQLKDAGRRAGFDALRLRVGANPGVSFRPWFEATPFIGLHERGGGGIGAAAGASKSWGGGVSLEGEAYFGRLWDEGYETSLHDGRRHGVRIAGTLPVSRRFTLTGEADYEWLALGPNAPGGGESAGRRAGWTLRAEYTLLKRDGAFMGYGFRDGELWSEQLVPVELGVYADASWRRYYRPGGFTALNPSEKSLNERVGVFYYQAVSPKIGFNAEAFVGRDPAREIGAGELYGFAARLNLVFSPHCRIWLGWGYESGSDSLGGGGGANRNFSAGMSYIF